MHQHGARKAGFIEGLNRLALKTNTFVAPQDRFMLAAVSPGDTAVTLADRGWDMGDFKASSFARVGGSAERINRL
jgi:hypothetical protein